MNTRTRNELSWVDFKRLSERIGVSTDPEKVANTLFSVTRELITVNRQSLFVFADDASRMIPIGTGSAELLGLAMELREEGIIDWVCTQNKPLFTPGQVSDESISPESEIYVIPLKGGESPLGVYLIQAEESSATLNQARLTQVNLVAIRGALALFHAITFAEVNNQKLFLNQILESVNDVIFSTDQAGLITFVNHRVSVFGLDHKRLYRNPIYTLIPIEIDCGRMLKTLGNGEVFHYETLLTLQDGVEHRFEIHLGPLVNSDGVIVGSQGVMRDIHEHHLLEEEKLKLKRLEALNETSISIKHEINNPLTVIQGNVYLLESHLSNEERPEMIRLLGNIRSHTQRIAAVVKKLETIDRMRSVEYVNGLQMLDLHQTDDTGNASKVISSGTEIETVQNLPMTGKHKDEVLESGQDRSSSE